MNKNNPVLTKRDITKVAVRWILMAMNTYNFQSQQASSVVFALNPALRKIYKDDQEYLESVNNHYKYFNCMPWLANLILGATLAIEDNGGIKDKEIVQNFKTSLMGPLSGVGDTIFWVLIPTILGSISGYMALQNNAVGVIAWMLINVAFMALRVSFFHIGYRQGMKLITSFGMQVSLLTECASILGLTVVGSLVSSVVSVKVPLVLNIGEVGMEIQPMLDKVLPSLVPVLITFGVYKALKSKKIGITGMILAVIVLCMAAAYFGILG
ncbi:PTS system mannose/fructose/sorbose family transporter subunit IID [Lacrimispora indolis]|uniref:PTS system mannose/fructose/sorbose family transporter subunit IID n=1 Tax=Lacrimispora indolis TaxID=69825 RepID=UPI0004246144|nr:PTS system mannose/fructose/sorbose family transporter subunit IID [[Clostridium] methoxybenzovorans]